MLAEWKLFFGVIAAVAMGLSFAGWNITLVRFLYTNAMPPQKAPSYTAVYNAIFGLSGAIGPFVAGQFLRILSRIVGPSSLAAAYHSLFLSVRWSLITGVGILSFSKSKDRFLHPADHQITGGGVARGSKGNGRLIRPL